MDLCQYYGQKNRKTMLLFLVPPSVEKIISIFEKRADVWIRPCLMEWHGQISYIHADYAA